MFKKPCIIIPPCPRCNSNRTGYYIFSTSTKIKSENKIIAARMKRGELVRVVFGIRDPEYPDCFCENCNIEWHAPIVTKFLTSEEIEKIKKEKQIENKEIELLNEPLKRKSFLKRNFDKIKDKAKNLKLR